MDNPTKVMVSAGIILPEVDPHSTPKPIRTQTSSSSSTRRSTSKLFSSLSSSSRSSKSSSEPSGPPKKKADEPFVCPICFDDDPSLRTLSLDCEHTFCSGCWTAYLNSKIRDEGEHYIRCMAEGCALVAPDSFVRSTLIPDSGVPIPSESEEQESARTWTRFQELLVRHFVSCNPSLKFCPYPSCTNTVSCPSASSKSSLIQMVPIVSCGARGMSGESSQSQSSQSSQRGLQGKEHKFCFGCPIESDHRPVICPVAKMWLKKCRDDSETANWIKSNTKECSQCQSTIEKNGGCKCVVNLVSTGVYLLAIRTAT
jgi:ariadne-1